MDTALQQRIVGAIVLVALGVIFIPALLDGSGYKSRHARSIDIPEKPAFAELSQQQVKPIPTPLDKTFDKVAQQKKPKSEPASGTSGKKSETPANLKSWMLQVGTFTSRKNADKYRDELRSKGYTAKVFPDKVKDKTIYKVRIGPDLSKQRMEKLRKKFKKQGVDAYIVSHG